MKRYTKGEFIAAVQALPCDDDTLVVIFDHRKIAHSSDGDGYCEGFYNEFSVDYQDEWASYTDDEKAAILEIRGSATKPFIALTFDNEELED